jgi:hypothetical protein
VSEEATELDSGPDPAPDPAPGLQGDVPPDMFKVSVTGTGVALARTVDQATALSIIGIALGGSASPAAPPGNSSPPPGRPAYVAPAPPHDPTSVTGTGDEEIDPHITIGEYIDECGAQGYPAKITAIGNFLEIRIGKTSFTKEEVKSQFRPAGEAQPGNFHRDFGDAITQRWISEVQGESGQYFVTKTGKSAIAGKFDKSLRRAAPARRKKPSAKPANGDSNSADDSDLQDLDSAE